MYTVDVLGRLTRTSLFFYPGECGGGGGAEVVVVVRVATLLEKGREHTGNLFRCERVHVAGGSQERHQNRMTLVGFRGR